MCVCVVCGFVFVFLCLYECVCVCVCGGKEILHNSVLFDMECRWGERASDAAAKGRKMKEVSILKENI